MTHGSEAMRPEPEKGEENRVSDVPLSGMVVERLARVEVAIDGLRHSQNLTIGATVGIGAILAGFIIAFGIYGLQRIDALDAKLNTFDAKLNTFDAKLNTFDAKFNTFDAKLNTVEARIDRKIDQKFDAFAARFSEEAARNRQELIGIATAIGNAITAARPPPPGNPSGSAVPPGPIGGGSSPPGPR